MVSCKNGFVTETRLLTIKRFLHFVFKNLLDCNYRYANIELPIVIALGGWHFKGVGNG